jgi:hypothetical protein
MTLSYLDWLTPLDLAVPQDRPFGTAEAIRGLGTPDAIRAAVHGGLLISPVRGVYHVATLDDDLSLRIECLRLVVPRDAVICDRSAGWLHGAPRILAPGAHLVVPPVDVYLPLGRRLRNSLAESGSRGLGVDDVMTVSGLTVTTPLRTACDLGRLLHRDQAIAALDSLLRIGEFTREDLLLAPRKFPRYRGVVQLRELVPLADGRSQSPGESVVRLRWIDCGDLPRPEPQWEVVTPWGSRFLDLALPELKYAGEYDGEEFHGPDQEEHDEERRAWLRDDGWIIDVFRKENVYGPQQDADLQLRAGVAAALARRRTS